MNATIEFDAPVKAFAEAFNLQMGIVCKVITLDLFTRVTMRTPVDTGRARAGWQIAIGAPSEFLPPEVEGKSGEDKASGGMKFTSLFNGGKAAVDIAAAGKIDGGELIYITNNLPYIEALEFGHSKQAPAGMVRLSVAEVAAEIELMLEAKLKNEL